MPHIRRTPPTVVAPLLASLVSALSVAGEAKVPAFPGAEGAGAGTPGGRGGRVMRITTLEDYRPGVEQPIAGSLRAAVEARGRRFVVFRVAGTIALKADLDVREPFITIAGQTAPGGGVCLRDWAFTINTHDVIVRHLRIRPGDVMKKEHDGINCGGQDVVLDHCSVSWGIDETLSVTRPAANVTVQWCMITESLNRSYHKKGPHGYGSLINGPGPISFHHNLYAFHRSRSPRPGDGTIDFRNNVIYGWGDRAGYCGDNRLELNYVANYLRPGPFSKAREHAFFVGGPLVRLYVDGNVLEGAPDGSRDNTLLLHPPRDVPAAEMIAKMIVRKPFAHASVRTDAAEAAFRKVLDESGATLPKRDAVDARIVDLVRAGKGRIIDSQADVGGWPVLEAASPPPDADADGMPDAWEKTHGLNPADDRDANEDADGDGYVNVEEFANGTNPRSPSHDTRKGDADEPTH